MQMYFFLGNLYAIFTAQFSKKDNGKNKKEEDAWPFND